MRIFFLSKMVNKKWISIFNSILVLFLKFNQKPSITFNHHKMQKITLVLVVLFSQITFGYAKITETEKLAATCKVWGFLKYYHPKVAGGEVNWDNQLLEKLPKIEKAQTKEEFSLILENWIDELGPIKEVAPIAIPKEIEFFDKNFDLSWFNAKLFSKKLSKKLKFIEENRFQGEQYYVGTMSGENVFVKNENFKDFNYNEKNSRVIAAFMYWNLIEYFFPYKYVMDQNWDVTLQKMLPELTEAKNEDDFFIAMKKLSVLLNDSHAIWFIYPKEKAINFFPAQGKIIDEKIIVTEIFADSLAKADDIKIGDIITKINGKTINEIIAANRNLVNCSNEAAYLNYLAKSVLSGAPDTVELEFQKEGKAIKKTINWYSYYISHSNENKKGVKKEKFKLLDNNIGYVNMGLLKVQHVPSMISKLKSAKAIVFDMRNYPNATFEEVSNFLNAKEEPFALYAAPDLNYPGKYKWVGPHRSGKENPDYYKGKVVLLLNENSESQAEWTAMCFQTAGNTTIVGSQTSGADGNVTDLTIIRGIHTRFSGIGVYYPDKRETQRIGIVPDIEVKPTIKGIQEGRDEVLDRALVFIETGK